jgi:hypothetical protein
MTTSNHGTAPTSGSAPGVFSTGVGEEHPWAQGFSVFAAIIMMTVGVLHVIAGLAAILNGQFYVVGPNYVFSISVAAWGWVHLLLGAVVGAAGYFVLSGRVWARVVGIVLAALSLIANFLFIPYYPLWSILIIALDVAIIWALCIPRRGDVNRPSRT